MKRFRTLFACPSLCAPIAGEAVPLSAVPDPVFSGELLGKGCAIRPAGGRILAPCDATVDQLFPTGHAVSLRADCGAEILIHVGIDTVRLGGAHFTVHTRTGARVRKGELLIEFDPDAIRAEGFDLITPVVVCNSGQYPRLRCADGPVDAGQTLIELRK